MTGRERQEDIELGRFWDDLVRGGTPTPSNEVDPAFAETVRRLHALDDLPQPDPVFAERTWQRIRADRGRVSIVVPGVGLMGPNGHGQDEDSCSADRDWGGRRPSDRGRAPGSAHHRPWVRPLLGLAAVLILSLVGSSLAVSWPLPQLAIHWQREQLLEAPGPASVPMFRGDPARTGVMPGPGPAVAPDVQWRFAPPPSAWRRNDGAYHPSPAVVGHAVYLGHPGGAVSAVDALTGAVLWQVTTGGTVAATPVVDGRTVYVGSADGYLYALDATTGAERWRQEIGGIWASPVVADGVIYATTGESHAAPAVDAGTVYVGGGFGGELVAIDAATGEERWSVPLPAAGLYAVEAASGQQHWHFPTERRVNSAPAVAHGVVYVGDFDHRLYAVEAATGRERWRVQVGEETGRAATQEAFRTPDPAPAVAGSVVYAAGGDGTLMALDAASGAERWGTRLGTGFVTAPAVAGGVVYIGQRDGMLSAVDAATGWTRWTVQIDGPIEGPPAVVDGIVYVATTVGTLVALAD